ncbi:hypothetical protein HK099_006906 [Clydaea vesicula]|uniref:Fe2OG dioxygenase domain-containing protein n=1 Tax=Clydaea vesicula TaxID=447962 RepID=A0AAD5TXR6_9FUNG|nr:hypothetical protein HK099_006906 [Clydaea vesicula]
MNLNLNLPLIDISPFLKEAEMHTDSVSNAIAKKASAELMDKGHGIEDSKFKEILSLAREFFSQSPDEKEKISITKGDLARGYQRLGQNVTQYENDWHEGLDLYCPINESHKKIFKDTKIMTGENQWPTVKNFKKTYESYFKQLDILGRATMRCMALALGQEENFFLNSVDNSFWVCRVIGYPPLTKAVGDNVGISCGEHTDYGCLTFLLQDETKDALQVLSKSGEWVNGNPVPGALVVNIGDCINIWTNNIYKSTLHRVIHKSDSYRISVPFFFEPNLDAKIEALESCLKETGGEVKNKPVIYGEHLLSKVSKNFEL